MLNTDSSLRIKSISPDLEKVINALNITDKNTEKPTKRRQLLEVSSKRALLSSSHLSSLRPLLTYQERVVNDSPTATAISFLQQYTTNKCTLEEAPLTTNRRAFRINTDINTNRKGSEDEMSLGKALEICELYNQGTRINFYPHNKSALKVLVLRHLSKLRPILWVTQIIES